MSKKILCAVLAVSMVLALCCNVTFAAGGITISGGDTNNVVSGDAGDTITVPVNISGNTDGLYYFLITLTYDPDYLTPVSTGGLVKGDITGLNGAMGSNPAASSTTVKINTSSIENSTGNGLLFGYKFVIKDTIATREQTTVSITVNKMRKFDSTDNPMDCPVDTVNNATVKINPDLVTPVTVELSELAKTYNGEAQGAKVTLSNTSVAYEVKYNNSTTIPTNAGTYNVVATVTEEGYSGSATGSLVISQAPISVTADNKSKYVGENDPALTYTKTSGTFYGSDNFSGNVARVQGEGVGEYDINQGTLTVPDNYNLTFTKGTFTINAKKAWDVVEGTMPASVTYGDTGFDYTYSVSIVNPSATPYPTINYTSSNTDVATVSADGRVTVVGAGSTDLTVTIDENATHAKYENKKTLTVAKKAIAVKANDITAKIGEAEKSLTYTITGALVGSDDFTGSLARVAGNTVGEYAISQGTLALSPNYDLTFVGGTYTIVDKTPQTITVADFGTKTYGDANFSVSVTPDATSGLKNYSYTSSDERVATVSDAGEITIVGAGEVDITVVEAGDDTYARASVEKHLVINKAPLTIKPVLLDNSAEITSFVYGDEYTVVGQCDYLGFVNSEDARALLTEPSITEGMLVAGQKPGSYKLKAGGATSDNYEITYVDFDYTVTKRPVKITSFGVFSKNADATTVATLNPSMLVLETGVGVGMLSSDDVTFAITSPLAFDSAEAGTRTVTLDSTTTAVITGTDSDCYEFVAPTPSIVANAEIYNGNMTAQDIADQLNNNIVIKPNQTQIELPVVPEGYEVVIESSNNPGVIATDGTIIPSDVDVTVAIIFTVRSKVDHSDAGQTVTYTLVVPRAANKLVTPVVYGNGTLTGDVGEQPYNSSITLTATPNDGYKVLEWFVDGVSIGNVGNAYTFVLTDDVEVAVKFVNKSSGTINVGGGSNTTTVKAPTASIGTGATVFKGTAVKLSCATTGAKVYYTVDGTVPTTTNAKLYTDEGIRISADTVIKAFAIKDNKEGTVETFSYKVKTASVEFKSDAANIKYMASTAADKFEPDRAATRYEVIDALSEILDIEDAKVENGFSDVDAEHADIVGKFAATSIIDGYPDKTFGGTLNIARAEFVKMLAEALRLDASSAEDSKFTDVKGHWAEKYIGAFSKLGYILGDPDGNFRPDDNITRAEVVAVINRVIKVTNDTGAAQTYTDLTSDHWAYDTIMTVAK